MLRRRARSVLAEPRDGPGLEYLLKIVIYDLRAHDILKELTADDLIGQERALITI